MQKKRYGDPITTYRLPVWQISGLKLVANKLQTTPSAIIRELVAAFLLEHGITDQGTRPIDGQCRMDV